MLKLDAPAAPALDRDAYVKAGRIASAVREEARKTDWVGRTVLEMCEEIESKIRAAGAACAFPVNASINETAAHYTAEPGDRTEIRAGDLLKIDLGAQMDGWIADTAVTVSYDSACEAMVGAAEEALGAAMAVARDGIKASELGRAVEKSLKKRGYMPIVNLSGHSLDRHTIHAGRSIPNIWSIGSFKLSSGSAYACEPFVTAKDGLGFVKEGKARNIFSVSSRKRTKNERADELLEDLWERYNALPFARRWLLDKYDEAESEDLLALLVKKKAVRAYPVLVEGKGRKVAQAEHTFIPGEDGPLVTTS